MTQHLDHDTTTEPAFDFDATVAPILGISGLDVPQYDAPRTTPLRTALADATVGLLVTCGAYYPDQKRLGERGDLSYRLLPRERDLDEVLFAHKTPIRAFALADPNVAYPRDTMLDLEREGVFRRYADHAISMVGSISDYPGLVSETAPKVVSEFERMGVDLVLVLPFCPQCHVAAGVLARAIEERGLPTTSLTTLRHQAESVKPPRATFLDFPLGCPAGRPRRPAQQREIVRGALETAASLPAGDPWALHRLPFRWDESGDRGWESLVADLYRVDNEIRGTVKGNMRAHGFEPGGEHTIRCAC
ncbi:hypothetical protein VSH64_18860 [Amycolatopsis rhabdoformis]|uniref:Glycine reductase n=1 Tax=Amycolatopsis rhabdoformis TaxID=1448059 RepID=A0ABZ1IK55_9PSEU|nr:hypothetical protein [Amycolatopsis rhabdoformis]WSE34133.1 hypothetical protein VSH64_18860 [Amycolatopsis rhabdoformis]